jgi:hypothetical protein
VFGSILDKTAKFKKILLILCICSLFGMAASFFTLPSQNVPIFSVNLLILGASVIPVVTVCYSFSVELTYPISEAMSNGMMIMVSLSYATALVNKLKS